MKARSNGDFGRLLRQLRIAREQSRAEIAEITNISIPFYGALERGVRNPSVRTLARLHSHFHFDANAVLDHFQVTLYAPTTCKRGPHPAQPQKKVGPHVTFGRFLADSRRDSHLTQFALARALGITASHVNKIERGHVLPSITRTAQWHRMLRFNANIMLTHLDNPKGSTPTKETDGERQATITDPPTASSGTR